ncbi:hypothetical protein HN51_028855 [Arachis hypogaea]
MQTTEEVLNMTQVRLLCDYLNCNHFLTDLRAFCQETSSWIVSNVVFIELLLLQFESEPEFLDLERTMAVPGCDYVSFKVKDLPDLILFHRSGEIYTLFLSVCQKASLVDGIIVNTFNDLEL